MSSQTSVDLAPYNTQLTRFGIARGDGGSYFADKMAPRTQIDNQDYAVPTWSRRLEGRGQTDTKIGPEGRPNIRATASLTTKPGRAERRGLRGEIPWEFQKGPFGRFYASAESETASNVDSLRYQMEIKVKALLDAQKIVSGYYATPTTKWDAAAFAADIIGDMEAASDAASNNANFDLKSGYWEWYMGRPVARVIGAWLREKLKYTDGMMQLGGIIPDNLAGLPVNVSGLMHNTAKPGQTAAIGRVWSSDDVYLVYSDPSFGNNLRAFTAMAQLQWSGVTPPYGTKVFNDPEPDIYKTWVSTDVYDSLELLSPDGAYVLPHVLTTLVA